MLRHYTLSSFSRSWKFLPLSLSIKILKYFSFTGRIREGEIPLRAGRAASTNGEGSTLYQSTSARKRGLPNGCRTTKGKVWKAAGMTLLFYVLVFLLSQAGNQTSPLITFTLWPQCFSQKINFFWPILTHGCFACVSRFYGPWISSAFIFCSDWGF